MARAEREDALDRVVARGKWMEDTNEIQTGVSLIFVVELAKSNLKFPNPEGVRHEYSKTTRLGTQ
jgi:hypothetical protein